MQLDSPLERYYFEKYVLDVCITTLERGGATSKVDTYEFISAIDAWGIPQYPDQTAIVPPEADLAREIASFITFNERLLKEPNCWLGTWIDPHTRYCHLDITTIYHCLAEAARVARTLNRRARCRIVALYDFKRSQPIYLGRERERVSIQSSL
jgi:hypothetical protein